jgi:hypothetical protein
MYRRTRLNGFLYEVRRSGSGDILRKLWSGGDALSKSFPLAKILPRGLWDSELLESVLRTCVKRR